MPPAPLLELRAVAKSFGGVAALKGVDFTLDAGEIHGLVGENGAGKSTLMKIIAGVHAGDQGEMRLAGDVVRFRSARDARAAGIGMVHQELAIVPTLSVAENVLLGMQPRNRLGFIDWPAMIAIAKRHLENLGLVVDPRAEMASLPLGMQQLIEIARVLFSGARLIILDEPTSALSPPEITRLFALLKRLRAEGRSFIFISHFLDDVLAICDRVTVFRNGAKAGAARVGDIDKAWLIERMIGAGHHELEESYLGEIQLRGPEGAADAAVVLAAEGLGRGTSFQDVSLTVRAGEVLGIYGFMGSGQLDLARALFGKTPPERGILRIEGRAVRLHNTTRARRAGLAFVPESRRSMLFALEPLYKNMSISVLDRLARLWLKPQREQEIARRHIAELSIRPAEPDRPLGTLSGGNQQKVALAKWLTFMPKVLLLSEPTRGMDVGAKEDVVRIVRRLRDEGLAIIVASAEPETVLALADRILVMRKGRIAHEFADQAVSKDRLLAAA